jgi:dTDP-4-dehydrorhamnose reductase
MSRSILVTGGAGQVGIELARADWDDDVALHFPTRSELDISDPASVEACFSSREYGCVINLAAYTAVDKAEEDSAGAFLTNAQGPANLAEATRRAGIPIIHVSTDYVFNGQSPDPYTEDDCTEPLSVYGASKLAGELAVRSGNARSVIMRTAWVVSPHRTNFIKTMFRLARTNSRLRVVADQRGCPTSAKDIADALRTIASRALGDPEAPWGTYHFVNGGETTWHGLAEYIFEKDLKGLAGRPRVEPIRTEDYPTPALRPRNSRLDTRLIQTCLGIVVRPWQEAIDEIIGEICNLNDVQSESA